MESSSEGSYRPSITFPLGLLMLILALVSISGFFSCCYNWSKLRNLLLQSSPSPGDTGDDQSDDSLSHSITVNDPEKPEELHDQTLAVVMAGEDTPKYLAFPAPLFNTDIECSN